MPQWRQGFGTRVNGGHDPRLIQRRNALRLARGRTGVRVRDYDKEAKKNDAAGRYAKETLPTLHKHLETAQSLAEHCGAAQQPHENCIARATKNALWRVSKSASPRCAACIPRRPSFRSVTM
jgi:hypothetical protein